MVRFTHSRSCWRWNLWSCTNWNLRSLVGLLWATTNKGHLSLTGYSGLVGSDRINWIWFWVKSRYAGGKLSYPIPATGVTWSLQGGCCVLRYEQLVRSRLSLFSGPRRKLATYVATSATFVHLVFYNEYQMPGYNGKHCFTDIQLAYHDWVDRNIWGIKKLPAEQATKSEKWSFA